MASDKNKPKVNQQQIGDAIKANADSLAENSGLDVTKNLQTKLDDLEFRFEELGRAQKLQDALSEYVHDLKEEVADIRRYRLIVTICAVVMSVSLFALLIACMVSRPVWFMALDGSLQVPLIVALGGGSVFLMSLVLRGVYRSRHERNHGDMLPEAVRLALETLPGK